MYVAHEPEQHIEPNINVIPFLLYNFMVRHVQSRMTISRWTNSRPPTTLSAISHTLLSIYLSCLQRT